jgi:hypothetical protein
VLKVNGEEPMAGWTFFFFFFLFFFEFESNVLQRGLNCENEEVVIIEQYVSTKVEL